MKMKSFLTLFASLLTFTPLQAQTWDGSSSTDWNTPANWSTNAVPVAAGNVIIPNTANKPVLAGNVTINSFSMSLGSGLNFNGFTLTSNGAFDIVGATLTNSNGATDIVININGTGGLYFRQSVVNDNIIFNHNSASGFLEGYQFPNTFNGNTTFNCGGAGILYTSYDNASTYNGNVTVNRTVAGGTEIFRIGAVAVTGNFSYTNNAGGNTAIHAIGTTEVPISGTINITATGTGNPTFSLERIQNNTTGGMISVQNSGFVNIAYDTLLVTALNVNGYTGPNVDDFFQNKITGTVNISEAPGNTGGGHYFRGNTITGTTTITTNSASILYEAYQYPNTYNGNTTFSVNGTGGVYISYDNASTFNGNVTVNRTAAGLSEIFRVGAVAVTGNFSYTNNAGGITAIHSSPTPKVVIGGTINISATGAGNPTFSMERIQNNTSGGTILVQNSGFVTIAYDTLRVTALNVNGYTGPNTDEFFQNQITGAVSISDAAGNTGASQYFRGNTITGNTSIVVNSASAMYEGYQYPNTFNGNASFSANGSGGLFISYDNRSTYNGNVTVNRTVAGVSEIFRVGAVGVTGNFSYTNNAGGITAIHQFGTPKVLIAGTINITATGAGNPVFSMERVQNNTSGGTISIQNSGFVTIAYDTLLVTAFNVNGYIGASTDDFLQNQITGDVNISDGPTNSGGQYFRRNTINGNTTITNNSPGIFYESYQGSNVYNGNLSLVRNDGVISFAYDNPAAVRQNLTLNSSTGITFTDTVKFAGNINAAVEQLGLQPIVFPKMQMLKTGGAVVTLNDSVTITTRLNFNSGNIKSSTLNQLKFIDNATHLDASISSHVIGPVTKAGDDIFTFPVGASLSYNPLVMTAPVGAATRFSAEYKNQNPGSDGYNTALKAGSFGAAAISQSGYWDVQRLTGVTNVTLTLGFGTNPYEQYPNLANLKVAHWNGAQWDDHGNAGTTGTAADGTVVNSIPITSFSPFTLAGVSSTYFYVYGNPGAGPDGTPVKFKGTGGYPPYNTRQLPAGAYSADSIYLVPNGSSASFKLRDFYNVEKNDTTVTVAAAPTTYITANGNGSVNFTGWRHFVYLKNGSNQIIGAIRDNNLTLGNTTMTAYFSTPNVATAPNGNIYLKRSFKVTSQFAPVGTRRVRFYILKTEYNNLVAADPTSFPNGINSLTITKYTGPQEDSLFNPLPGGNSSIIPNNEITIVDMGTMYSLDIDVTGFSGFYIGGNQANVSLCTGATISVPSNVNGTTYQWQVNTGSGFANISNGAVYGGAATKTLTLTNVPSSYYGYQYRAFVNGTTFSQVYTLKFTATWQGTVNNVWENTANWNCGILPDANTDVLINAGKANYPQVGANTSVRTVRIASGATATIKTGFNLTITQ